MGDKIKPEGTARQIGAYVKNLPKYLRATAEGIAPFEQANVNARGTIDPQNLALDESLLKYFGPRFAAIGNEMARTNALAGAGTELDVLRGPGGALAREGQELNKEIDPEYYGVREAGARKFLDLLGGQDPNRLTGAEMANVERGLNRTNRTHGVSDVSSSAGAINNAMTFGRELDRKRNTVLNTLSALPSNLAAFKSGTDAFQVATGRSSVPNQGFGQFQTGRQGFGNNVSAMGAGLLGETGQNVRQNIGLDANKRDAMDRVFQGMSATGDLVGGIC